MEFFPAIEVAGLFRQKRSEIKFGQKRFRRQNHYFLELFYLEHVRVSTDYKVCLGGHGTIKKLVIVWVFGNLFRKCHRLYFDRFFFIHCQKKIPIGFGYSIRYLLSPEYVANFFQYFFTREVLDGSPGNLHDYLVRMPLFSKASRDQNVRINDDFWLLVSFCG